MATLTVSLPDEMTEFVEAQVGEDFADTSAYLADLVRRDQEKRIDELRHIVEDSLASGASTRTTKEIFQEAVSIAKARGTYRD
jgi:Arc/MetJ-type ribon-helix-helix transcriptional regulator